MSAFTVFTGFLILLSWAAVVLGNSGDANLQTTSYCPSNWTNSIHDSSLCYKVFVLAKNYTEAEAECEASGGHLVTIQDIYAHTDVLSVLSNVHEVWIGLSRPSKDSTYRWKNGMSLSLYSSWEFGERIFSSTDVVNPEREVDKSLRNCASMSGRTGHWKDRLCSKRLSYVCEAAASAATTERSVSAPVSDRECDDGWIFYEGYCYFFSSIATTSAKIASQLCSDRDSSLTSIQSANENAFIFVQSSKVQLKASQSRRFSSRYNLVNNFYIGLKRSGSYGFEWENGDRVKFTAWHPYQPDDLQNVHKCTEFQGAEGSRLENGFWSDLYCNAFHNREVRGYICKKPGASLAAQIPAPSGPTPLLTPSACPTGWSVHKSQGRHLCYTFPIVPPWNWTDARDFCRSRYGADLISVHDAKDYDFISSQMSNNGLSSIWLGLTDKVSEGRFAWSDDSPVSYLRFEPKTYKTASHRTDRGDCVKMPTSGKAFWTYDFCSSPLKFGCQMSLGQSRKLKQKLANPPSPTPSESTKASSLACPPKWIRHKFTCYLFEPIWLSWETSSKACHGQRATLATIESRDEQTFLTDYLIDHPSSLSYSTWIGLSDKESKGEFQWKNQTNATFYQWDANQSGDSKSNEKCVAMISARYRTDLHCRKLHGFICQKPVETQDQLQREHVSNIAAFTDEKFTTTTTPQMDQKSADGGASVNTVALVLPTVIAVLVIIVFVLAAVYVCRKGGFHRFFNTS